MLASSPAQESEMSNPNPHTQPTEPEKILLPSPPDPAQRTGRPRSMELHRRILDVAYAMAEKRDYGAITIQMVAKEAQVAKTTIYRWWESKAALILEATSGPPLQIPDTGSLRGDLANLLEQFSPSHAKHVRSHITLGLWADLESCPPDSPASRLHMARLQHEKAVIQEVLLQALKVGELEKPQSPELTFALLRGLPLHLRLILKATPGQLSNGELVDHILASLQN